MKMINKSITILFLLLSTQVSFSQENINPYPDTLRITTDSQIELIFSFSQMKDREDYISDDLWGSILNLMEVAIESSETQEGVLVTYRKVKVGEEKVAKIEVSELESTTNTFLIGKDGMKEILADRIDFTVRTPKVAISFSISQLEELDKIKELSVESVWAQVSQKFDDQGRMTLYTGEGVFKYGNANLDAIEGDPGGHDNIEFSSGVGIGYYRDRFMPDLGYKLAINLPDRLGNPHLQFGVLYTQHYFFREEAGGDFNLDLYGFLSGFYSYRFFSKYEGGLGIGVLIHRKGDFYKGGTYKLSLYTQKNEKVNFTPELIFTNDFKDAFPAIKFGLSF